MTDDCTVGFQCLPGDALPAEALLHPPSQGCIAHELLDVHAGAAVYVRRIFVGKEKYVHGHLTFFEPLSLG